MIRQQSTPRGFTQASSDGRAARRTRSQQLAGRPDSLRDCSDSRASEVGIDVRSSVGLHEARRGPRRRETAGEVDRHSAIAERQAGLRGDRPRPADGIAPLRGEPRCRGLPAVQTSGQRTPEPAVGRRSWSRTQPRRPRHRLHAGRNSFERSAALSLIARHNDSDGSRGSSCSGAATTTMFLGSTTSPSSRTTRCSISSGPNGRVALSRPIRVDLPPQRMMPPVCIG